MDGRDGITHYVLVKSPGLVVSFSPVLSFLRQTLWKELARTVGKVPAGAVEVPLGHIFPHGKSTTWGFLKQIQESLPPEKKKNGIPSVPRMRPNNGIQHYARVCSRCFILRTIEGIGIT